MKERLSFLFKLGFRLNLKWRTAYSFVNYDCADFHKTLPYVPAINAN